MAESGENYTAFNSRALVEVVGDVTDEALKATKIKQLLSVLAGRFFNWGGRKSLFTLHLGIKCCAIEMAAAATPRFDGDRFGVCCSVHHLDNPTFFSSMAQSARNSLTRLFVSGSKCQNQSIALQWANVQSLEAHTSNLTTSSKVLTPSFQSMFTSQVVRHVQKHSSMDSDSFVRRSFESVVRQAQAEMAKSQSL